MILKYGFAILGLAAIFAVLPFDNKSCAQGGGGSGGTGSGGSGSGGIAPQTCDTQVWQTMEMRARMETEREIMQNQNLIFKPDSILAYTCFDKFAEHAAEYGGVIFTHTKYWDGKEIINWGPADPGMDHSMTKVVLDSMATYIESNFGYSLLGDRGNDLGAKGLDPYVTSKKGRGSYACNRMNAVWKAAKCINFIHNKNFEDSDGYYPYLTLKPHNGGEKIKGYEEIKETRKYPANMVCDGDIKVYQNTWNEAWLKSRNENSFGNMSRFYEFSQPLKTTFEDVRKKVDPGRCDNAIYTGVTVIESAANGGGKYADGVCTNPGCVYVKSGNSGSCQPAGGSPGPR